MLKSFNLSIIQSVRVAAVRSYATALSSNALKKKISLAQQAIEESENSLRFQEEKIARAIKEGMAKEKKLALKPYRGVNGFAFFVRSRKSSDMNVSSAAWNNLEESVKLEWDAKAAEFTAQEMKKFPPAPPTLLSKYQAFLKEQYPLAEGANFGEKSTNVSKRWSKLSDEEKNSYTPSDAAKEAYAKIRTEWEQFRLKTYREKRELVLEVKRAMAKKRRLGSSDL